MTGKSGRGKGFINALRGVGPEDQGVAEVGVTETTVRRTPYKHPKNETMSFGDMADIGTMNISSKDYLKKMKFQKYDFCVIISATQFAKLKLDLAKAIRFMKKNYYFVRAEVDIDLDNEKKCKPQPFDREKTLQQIRSYYVNTFSQINMDVAHIFLISNHDLPSYDFSVLMDTLFEDLPDQKDHNFMLSLPNITDANTDRKHKSKYIALRAGTWATIPTVDILMDDVEKIEDKVKQLPNQLWSG